MFDAAIKALTQMFSPPFRRVLLKSIGLGLVLIVLMGVGLQRLFSWMATAGATSCAAPPTCWHRPPTTSLATAGSAARVMTPAVRILR